MKITLETEPLRLDLRDPFTLSYGTSTVRTNVLVRLRGGGLCGLGEAALPPYYGESAERVEEQLRDPTILQALSDSAASLDAWLAAANEARIESLAARGALDVALHDLWGKREGLPLYRLWGHDPGACPPSSITVAMDHDEASYRRRVRAARGFGLVKLKLGSGDLDRDLQLARVAVEELGGRRFCIDANGGWTADEALTVWRQLAPLRPLYVEQPVARGDLDGWRALRAGLSVAATPGAQAQVAPHVLIADESAQVADDIPQLAGLADGVNIKLAKCGGLAPAREMIRAARRQRMTVLIGCMIESSLGVTAAAQLAPAADLVDLDGDLLISNDPFYGLVHAEGGRIVLPDGPGIGVVPRPGSACP